MVFPAWEEFKKFHHKGRVRIEVNAEDQDEENGTITKAWYYNFVVALFEDFDANIEKMSKWFRKKASDEDLYSFLIIKKQIEEDPKVMHDLLLTYQGLLRQTALSRNKE